MASEKLLSSRLRIILFSFSTASFTGAGIVFCANHFPVAGFLFLTGIVILLIINSTYNSTNDAISFLFEALKNDDTSVHFQEKVKNRSLSRVYKSINALNDHFQNIKMNTAFNESFYRTIIQNASTGILIMGKENKIDLINRKACEYAGISPSSSNPEFLKIKHPSFFRAVCNLKEGETIAYKNLVSGSLQLLMFRASYVRRKEEEIKLVVIQDIRNELESKEIESYRKLISVLTHEIMNQLSPLTSVARELHSMLIRNGISPEGMIAEDPLRETTISGLKLINEQSEGLVNFMNNYRKISRIPQPEFHAFSLEEWSQQLRIAFLSKMNKYNIEFTISHDRSPGDIIADRKLLNQVMINLINNAYDAVMENRKERKISVRMVSSRMGKNIIQVSNNGPAIPPSIVDKIFVPFFTTKKNGSGIGLSISQEIMNMHNGSITLDTTTEHETKFVLEF